LKINDFFKQKYCFFIENQQVVLLAKLEKNILFPIYTKGLTL